MLVAIDRSTATGSAALFSKKNEFLASVSETGGGHGDAFCLIEALLAKSRVPVSEFTRFAVGIGPGSFSGIRSAIAVLSGLALPLGEHVEGVSSAAAANAAFRASHPEFDSVAVVGDARRGHLWLSVFEHDTNIRNSLDDFQVIDRAAVAESIPCHAAVITPDMDRLGSLLLSVFKKERVFAVLPTAEAVGRLAILGSSAMALPIYLHPAVMPEFDSTSLNRTEVRSQNPESRS